MSEVASDSQGGVSAASYANMFSRDEVLKCPHMMALLGYLFQKHNIPKYGWRNKELRYHYTDAAGLIGIISTSRLWATDIRFLNDPSEGMYLPERLLSFMHKNINATSGTEQKIIDGIRVALNQPRSKYATYCVSLSAEGDLLSQWRGYGGFGKGYAIGLNLNNGIPHPQLAHYYDIVYGDEGLDELATDLLDLFVSASAKWRDRMYEEWAVTLSVLAKSFKDINYIEERESRIVCSGENAHQGLFSRELPVCYRARGGDIVPYVSLSLNLLIEDSDKPRLPIEQIIVGPGVDFDSNYSSITSLLKANAYESVEVRKSAIPFRS